MMAQIFNDLFSFFFFRIRLKHLQDTAGERLNNTGAAWAPIRTYKNGLDAGSDETKISDEAEQELEGK